MDPKDSFYVALSGTTNSLKHSFQLPQTISLYGDWSLGVLSLTFNSVFSDFLLEEDRDIYIKHSSASKWSKLLFPKVAVDTIQGVLSAINHLFQFSEDWGGAVQISLSVSDKLLVVKIKEGIDLQFSETLSKLLGIPFGIILRKLFTTFIQHQIVLPPPQYLLLCDLVKQEVFNNSVETFLTNFTLGKNWSLQGFHKEVPSPQYHKILKKDFQNIDFTLEQIGGTPVVSQSNHLTVLLHFKKTY